MSKFETLISHVHEMAHTGELDRDGLMAIGSKLGIARRSAAEGVYGELVENDSAYFHRVHEILRSSDGLAELGIIYEAKNADDRRQIGRAINEVRIQKEKHE